MGLTGTLLLGLCATGSGVANMRLLNGMDIIWMDIICVWSTFRCHIQSRVLSLGRGQRGCVQAGTQGAYDARRALVYTAQMCS